MKGDNVLTPTKGNFVKWKKNYLSMIPFWNSFRKSNQKELAVALIEDEKEYVKILKEEYEVLQIELKNYQTYLQKNAVMLLNNRMDQTEISQKVEESYQKNLVLIVDVNKNIDNAISSSVEAKNFASKGNQALDSLTKTVEKIGEIPALLENFSMIFTDVSNKMKGIDEIVFMSKLLSFNATIEAAHLGENGRGMAVVAQQMTKLSEQIGATSRDIKSILKVGDSNIALARDSVEDLMKGSVSEIKSSQTSLGNIIESTLTLSELITSIANSLKVYNESNTATAEILNKMNQVTSTLGISSSCTRIISIQLEEMQNQFIEIGLMNKKEQKTITSESEAIGRNEA